MAPVTKFSYLKELVDTKVRSAIEGLPFLTEGYERAKNIMKTKYGDTSEIVNAYVQNIYLPIIQGTNAGKIHEFYNKQDAYRRRKHESRIRTSTALIPRETNMRELKQNSQHFSLQRVWFSYAFGTRH